MQSNLYKIYVFLRKKVIKNKFLVTPPRSLDEFKLSLFLLFLVIS